MTIQDTVYAKLAAIGTSYTLTMTTQNAAKPCTVYQFITARPLRYHAGNSHIRHRVQVSCWAETYAAAVTLANSVIAAFDLNVTDFPLSTLENSVDQKEVETGLSRQILEFDIYEDK